MIGGRWPSQAVERRSRRKGPGQSLAGAHSAIGSVLLVTPRWTRDGGVATHVIASAGALAARGLRGARALRPRRVDERVPGVTVVQSPALFDARTPRSRRGPPARWIRRPASIHVHQVDEPALLGWMRERAPVLVSAHGYTACTSGVHYFRPGEECMRAHGPGCVPNLALRGCAHTSNPLRLPADYRRAGRGLQTLRVLRSGHLLLDGDRPSPRDQRRRAATRRARCSPPCRAARGSGHAQRRRVVFAGRVVAPKGVAVLIRAAAEVDGGVRDLRRRLAARGRCASSPQATGVADRVRFTGWLGPEQLAQEFARGIGAWRCPRSGPSRSGSAGSRRFEAGRPVVASLTGGIGDWLEDGVNGLAVKPGDAARARPAP